MNEMTFLPGVPADRVLHALDRAGGDEIASGKLMSPESSAALAVNTFGWFIERPGDLPAFPGLDDLDWPAIRVEVERQMRFPWRGGRHPWLDAAVETGEALIGIESKRFEPFRDSKTIALSEAYDRDVWGPGMEAYERMRDQLRAGVEPFVHLDAAQLVKHAFGLVSEGRRLGKRPVLVYLYAEPSMRGRNVIPTTALTRHREEITRFTRQVEGAAVRFQACDYSTWLSGWSHEAAAHAKRIEATFQPW